MLTIFSVTLFVAFATLLNWSYLRTNHKCLSKFPGPFTLVFLLRNLPALVRNPQNIGELISHWFKKYGPNFTFWGFTTPILFTADPELIKILTGSKEHLTKHFLYNNFVRFFTGNYGLVGSEGSQWHEDRKVFNKVFNVKLFEKSLTAAVELYPNMYEKICSTKNIPFDPTALFTKLTMRILMKSCDSSKSLSSEESADTFEHSLERGLHLVESRIAKPWIMLPIVWKWFGYQKQLKDIHETLMQLLQKGQKYVFKLKAKDNDSCENARSTSVESMGDLFGNTEIDVQWRYEHFITFAAAGTDTTILALKMTLFFLANNPKCYKLAQDEVDLLFGKKNEFKLDYTDLSLLKYLKMSIKESLRLHPSVAAFGRTTTEDIQLADGNRIPEGTGVVIYALELHRNAEYFPNPTKFDPERFNESNSHLIKPYTYIPFSKGPRNCIGQKYAETVIPAILAFILKDLTVTTATKPEEIKYFSGIVTNPYPQVKLAFHRRK